MALSSYWSGFTQQKCDQISPVGLQVTIESSESEIKNPLNETDPVVVKVKQCQHSVEAIDTSSSSFPLVLSFIGEDIWSGV